MWLVQQLLDEMVPNSSKWTSHKYDEILRRHFKIKRQVLPLDEFISHTFYSVLRDDYEEESNAMQGILDYMDAAMRTLNTSERQMYPSTDEKRNIRFLPLLNDAFKISTFTNINDTGNQSKAIVEVTSGRTQLLCNM